MKKYLILLTLFSLFFCGRANAAITSVQKVVCGSTASGSACGGAVASTGSGHLLVIGLATHGSSETITAVTGGGTWVQVAGAQCILTGGSQGDFWYVKSSSSGATSIDVTTSDGTNYTGVFYEYAGTDNGNFDQVAALSNQTAASSFNGPSVTNASSGDVIVTMVNMGQTVSSVGGGFSSDGNAAFVADWASNITTSSGTFAPAWVLGGSSAWAGATVSFKAAAGGSASNSQVGVFLPGP